MFTKSVLIAGLVGYAAAFSGPMMSLQAGRREAIGAGVAGAAIVAAPLRSDASLSSLDTYEKKGFTAKPGKFLKAPVVEIFDARGCDAKGSNVGYRGKKSNDENDEMCVKVSMQDIAVSVTTAAKYRDQFLGLKQTAIDVDQISTVEKQY